MFGRIFYITHALQANSRISKLILLIVGLKSFLLVLKNICTNVCVSNRSPIGCTPILKHRVWKDTFNALNMSFLSQFFLIVNFITISRRTEGRSESVRLGELHWSKTSTSSGTFNARVTIYKNNDWFYACISMKFLKTRLCVKCALLRSYCPRSFLSEMIGIAPLDCGIAMNLYEQLC